MGSIETAANNFNFIACHSFSVVHVFVHTIFQRQPGPRSGSNVIHKWKKAKTEIDFNLKKEK